MTILNHPVEVVHHHRDHKTLKITQSIILDHNQLTIIEMEIVQEDHSRVIDSVTLETI